LWWVHLQPNNNLEKKLFNFYQIIEKQQNPKQRFFQNQKTKKSSAKKLVMKNKISLLFSP